MKQPGRVFTSTYESTPVEEGVIVDDLFKEDLISLQNIIDEVELEIEQEEANDSSLDQLD